VGILPRPSLSSDAVVLRSWSCGETSVISSLLTREKGFIRIIAKAARRPKSRLRALVEPGRLVNVDFSLAPERELQYLRSGSVLLDPMTFNLDLERSAYLLAALELVDRSRPLQSTDGGGAAEDLFPVCDAFIRMLSCDPESDPARLFFALEWQLLRNHGLAPEVDHCSSCGNPHEIRGALWFNSAEGGLVCHTCGRKGGGFPLSREALGEFGIYDTGVVFEGKLKSMRRVLRREVGAHLHRFLGFHLPGYRLPTALDLLRPVKKT
jgi:DNA repair protein RecO (recombination protein O)